MRWNFDGTANAVYVTLLDDVDIARQEVFSSNVIADETAAGELVGIEVLCPHETELPLAALRDRYKLDDETVAQLLATLTQPLLRMAFGSAEPLRPETSSEASPTRVLVPVPA